MNKLFTTIALVWIAAPLVAQAQSAVWPYLYPSIFQDPYLGYPKASTVGEAEARGIADLLRAAGENHWRNSQAAINYEQARSQSLDNALKRTQTYFEMRKCNTASRKAAKGRGLTTEESWKVAQMYLPKRLSEVELDPATGAITWPVTLRNPRYAGYRQQIEQLFVRRDTSHGGNSYETYTQIQQATGALLAELKRNINDYRANDFIKMKSFVESLAYEAKRPAA